MSFYSLWQHYISMTSRPLANSDKGVMRIAGITELMRLLRLSPSSLAHYATLYLLLSLLSLSKALAPSSFLLPPCRHSSNSRSPLFFFFFPSLFIRCCQLLVPHLVILEHHSLNHSLKILSHSPSLCHNTLSK